MTTNLLKITNLKTHFFTSKGTVKAVDGVNIEIKTGESVGLVGESGSGKSVTATSIMGLVPSPQGSLRCAKLEAIKLPCVFKIR